MKMITDGESTRDRPHDVLNRVVEIMGSDPFDTIGKRFRYLLMSFKVFLGICYVRFIVAGRVKAKRFLGLQPFAS
jgi:hypothetical protein